MAQKPIPGDTAFGKRNHLDTSTSRFIDKMLESYTQPLGPNLIGRMRFLYNRVPLIYISTGISLEYDEMINAGLEMLMARIAIS